MMSLRRVQSERNSHRNYGIMPASQYKADQVSLINSQTFNGTIKIVVCLIFYKQIQMTTFTLNSQRIPRRLKVNANILIKRGCLNLFSNTTIRCT